MSILLEAQGCVVCDEPPKIFPFGAHDHNELVRLFVPYIETHLPDELAWEAIFSDPNSSHYDPMFNVSTALIVYGRERVIHKKRRASKTNLERQGNLI